jgi:hypothetical protein
VWVRPHCTEATHACAAAGALRSCPARRRYDVVDLARASSLERGITGRGPDAEEIAYTRGEEARPWVSGERQHLIALGAAQAGLVACGSNMEMGQWVLEGSSQRDRRAQTRKLH